MKRPPIAILVAIALVAFGAGPAQPQSIGTVRLAPGKRLPYEFSAVGAVREVSPGRALLVDRGDNKLLVVDFASNRVAQIGSVGSGPNEYRNPSALFAIGSDSTILADPGNDRWLLLAGAVVVATNEATVPPGVAARVPVAMDGLGGVFFPLPIRRAAGASPLTQRRDSNYLIRATRLSTSVDTITMLRARKSTISLGAPGGRQSVSVRINPLAPADAVLGFPDGWLAIARVDPYRVEWVGPDRRHVQGPILPFDPVRLDQKELEFFAERQARRTGDQVADPASITDWPAVMPPFLPDGLLGDHQGRLWIRRPPTSADPAGWYDVVDRKGSLRAHVSLDQDVRIVGFGAETVYTAKVDDSGIEHLERRPLPHF